jgi:hypothetical protein
MQLHQLLAGARLYVYPIAHPQFLDHRGLPRILGHPKNQVNANPDNTSAHASSGCASHPLLRYSAPMPKQLARPTLPSLPAEAALSFLKDTKGTLTWSARDLSETLNINPREGKQVLAFLQAQGYAQPSSASSNSKAQWLTTPAGEAVSGAKPPRFTRERVEQALADLQARIQQNNKDHHAPFRVTTAVAFGDFLVKDRARAQAADVGITLARREVRPGRGGHTKAASHPQGVSASLAEPRSASEAQAERAFLRQLRAKSALLNLRPYIDWMHLRSHRNLL